MAVDDDGGCIDGVHCSDHSFRSTSPGGGICAFCLQDKLGKLVSSSSFSFFLPSSSSSSPSSRSHHTLPSSTTSTTTTTSFAPSSNALMMTTTTSTNGAPTNNHQQHFRNQNHNNNNHHHHQELGVGGGYHNRRARIPFLLTQKKKKKSTASVSSSSSTSTSTATNTNNNEMMLKRSKSTSTPRSSSRYLPSSYSKSQDFTPRSRGFWSFLHLSHTKNKDKTQPMTSNPTATSSTSEVTPNVTTAPAVATAVVAAEEAEESPNSSGSNTASFGRKVSRSRSVGCGSRSFSGDFFERISTGFGDCTLRRVESHREGAKQHRHSTSRAAGDVIREKVRCGGLFGGFVITSSSSSTTSSSSSYWAPGEGRPTATPGTGPLIHGRSRSWGWAFASPMRAFANKPTTTTIKDGKTELGGGGDGNGKNNNNSNNGTTNLAAIPSLLAVRGLKKSKI